MDEAGPATVADKDRSDELLLPSRGRGFTHQRNAIGVVRKNSTTKPDCDEPGLIGGSGVLDNNVFSFRDGSYQYISVSQRTRLIRDYIRARDRYREAVARARRRYAEVALAGVPSTDGSKSEP